MNQARLFDQADLARYGDLRRKHPLILPKILANGAQQYAFLDQQQKDAHGVLIKWADLESSGKLQEMSETSLEGDFVAEVFGTVLGYTRFSENLDHWEIQQKFALPGGQQADAAIGLFGKDESKPPTVLIELKGPTANVDRDRSSGRTAVQQCWDYLNDVPECPWGIVCNYVSFRLYHRAQTPGSYELFTLQELRDEHRYREFLTLFDRSALLQPIMGQTPRALRLLQASQNRQKEVGAQLYEDYRNSRMELIAHLRRPPHDKPLDTAISIAQTLLDRIIFIAFCEDRELLPPRAIERTWREMGAWDSVGNPRWRNFVNLFRSMDKGNPRFNVPPFNGGLFAYNPPVDDLDLDDRWTDFFNRVSLYDFRDEVNVDVLGHIFEQSITDLESLRANPEMLAEAGSVSGRRKREGVFYTPRPITTSIVERTLGPCIEGAFSAIAEKHSVGGMEAPPKRGVKAWVASRVEMLEWLKSLRVCDLACGSGAFLIQAYDYLENVYAGLVRGLAEFGRRDEAALWEEVKTAILGENLFGVDLSPEAVEIARLAMWIRTAQRGQTLADLSDTIQCGNSIVDDPSADAKAFDWKARFPKVFAEGGFHCIVSNPPYVKLQNFRKRHPKVAAYLVQRYRSARTGNFDLYLPFIERGLELLRPGGRMGFIAPSVWLYNEYGRGLRELLLENKALDGFVNFKSHQVFKDATTYTALQFFHTEPSQSIRVTHAPMGELAQDQAHAVPYSQLSAGAWAFTPPSAQNALARIAQDAVPLGEATKQIFQGLITSADSVYHLTKLSSGHYFSHSLGREVDLEDALMRALVSGADAVPFAVPPTDRYLLFPYELSADECRLLTPEEMKTHRRTWAYLGAHERQLRDREGGKFDDGKWYRFGRNQNIDKQELPKLGVPQTVSHLSAFGDPRGECFFNNVRINGILERDDKAYSLWFLLGVLNTKALDFFFRHTAKPKDRGYFEANKQFIAPLPVPSAKPKDQKPVAALARKLADLHGERLEAFAEVRRRIIVDLTPRSPLKASPLPPPLSRKLQGFDRIPMRDALTELERFAKRKLNLAERGVWDSFLLGQANAVAVINREIEDLTGELNQRVYTLYGLDAADIKLIEDSLA
jgi:SAM-dependent methyltransferase